MDGWLHRWWRREMRRVAVLKTYCYATPIEMFSMHTGHRADVSKSVLKNATFPRTGGLPCLITHSCMSAASPSVVGGLIFCISATPNLGSLFPLFHDFNHVHLKNMCYKSQSNVCSNQKLNYIYDKINTYIIKYIIYKII